MVLVYGTICLDRIHRVPNLPRPGGYVEIASTELHLGGEAANTATALAKWKAPTILAGNRLGNDEYTKFVLTQLEVMGLRTDHIQCGDFQTPFCEIYVTPDGERTMFGSGFAQMPERSDANELNSIEFDWISVDWNLGVTAWRACEIAKNQGKKVYVMDLDLSGADHRPIDFWQSSTDTFGVRGDEQANLQFVSEQAGKYHGIHILTDSRRGIYVSGFGIPSVHIQPFPIEQPIDSTGAGDCFRAGMLYGLDLGWELADCLSFASAAGGLNATRVGANSNIPSLDEIRAHIARFPEIQDAFRQAIPPMR
ncbi:MAG: carbohydrate kinase family protein [Armatimonadetes bacterium]|nr:carbohydrate kinase family protein [Armatimonadota bacterium]